MEYEISPFAGKLAPTNMLIDVPKLITAYYTNVPDPYTAQQRVLFGTSGHRGSALTITFNEWHILAITQAICLYRLRNKITGPLFMGMDTHALSFPAFTSALEVLSANGVEVLIAKNNEYTPTPAISLAIVTYNTNRTSGFADGIVITPSHNPPQDGGLKYNPPTGGPAAQEITAWIEKMANQLLEQNLKGVKRITFDKALHAPSTHHYDFINSYVNGLGSIIDMQKIRDSNLHLGVDPLGGSGLNYWHRIAERYQINLSIVNETIDPSFSFVTMDWDGKIRLDPSSSYAMAGLTKLKNRFDIAFACDTDHDRHGIITPKFGLLPANHYLAIATDYLYQHRPLWNKSKAIGTTIVTSQMVALIATQLQRRIYEVPVGFKWFVNGLLNGSLGFAGEESAGASFSRFDGTVWTSDKDGITLALLSAEITAQMNCDLSDLYSRLENELGKLYYDRININSSPTQKKLLKNIDPSQIKASKLAGEEIKSIITTAPGNGVPFGGIKAITPKGWFAMRPSGTEDIYKIYAESAHSEEHLEQIIDEAQTIIQAALITTYNNS